MAEIQESKQAHLKCPRTRISFHLITVKEPEKPEEACKRKNVPAR